MVISFFVIWKRYCFRLKNSVWLSDFLWNVFAETNYAFDNILEIMNTFSKLRGVFFSCMFFLIFKIILQRKDLFSKKNVNMCNILFLPCILQEFKKIRRDIKYYLGETVLVVDSFCIIALWWSFWYVGGAESLYTNVLEKLITGVYIRDFNFRGSCNTDRQRNTHRSYHLLQHYIMSTHLNVLFMLLYILIVLFLNKIMLLLNQIINLMTLFLNIIGGRK